MIFIRLNPSLHLYCTRILRKQLLLLHFANLTCQPHIFIVIWIKNVEDTNRHTEPNQGHYHLTWMVADLGRLLRITLTVVEVLFSLSFSCDIFREKENRKTRYMRSENMGHAWRSQLQCVWLLVTDRRRVVVESHPRGICYVLIHFTKNLSLRTQHINDLCWVALEQWEKLLVKIVFSLIHKFRK